jgi:hypothetical protein
MMNYLKWAGIAFLVWYVINRPDDAAGVIQGMADALSRAADFLSTSMTSSSP